MENATAATKRKISIPIIVTAAVLAVVLVTVIILSVLPSKPMESFYDFQYASIYATSASSRREVHSNDGTSRYRQLNDALKTTEFSYMQTILEGKWNTAFTFERDDDDELVKVYQDTIDVLDFSGDQLLIELNYSAKRTLTVEGSTVEFDRVRLIFGDSGGDIGRIRIFAYMKNAFVGSDLTTIEDTYTTPFTITATTSALYTATKELLDTFA